MNKKLRQILILSIVLIPMAFSVGAYNNPTSAEKRPGNTSVEPIYVNSSDQVKNGGLTVSKTFTVIGGNAAFDQDVYLSDIVSGGNPSDTSSASSVAIGATPAVGKSGTSLLVNGDIITQKTFHADSLKTGKGNGLKPICAEANGKIILCK